MANIASALKDEIARVARKELRAETEKLKKASSQYRSDIAALKRRIADLEKQVVRDGKQAASKTPEAVTKLNAATVRFSAKGLQSHRQRLELSAADLSVLLGVSPQTIYNWERGKTAPRATEKVMIAALRTLGKKDAATHVERLRTAKP